MSRFIIPMFLVVEAETKEQAEDRAGELQTTARRVGNYFSLYLDEVMETAKLDDDCEPQTALDHCYFNRDNG